VTKIVNFRAINGIFSIFCIVCNKMNMGKTFFIKSSGINIIKKNSLTYREKYTDKSYFLPVIYSIANYITIHFIAIIFSATNYIMIFSLLIILRSFSLLIILQSFSF
jgi:hypothetical protein